MQEAALTDSSPFTCVCRALLVMVAVLLTACTTVPTTEDEHADYGPFPEDYQAIAKAYIQDQPTRLPLDTSTARFLNAPNKFIYNQLGRQNIYGYRVCLLVNTADSRQTQSNFLLIKDNKVITHLHDSGLIGLSDKFCNVQMLTLDTNQAAVAAAATVAAAAPVAAVDIHGFKYIVCRSNGEEKFFAFNAEKHQLLEERDGHVVTTLAMEQLSDTFIVATVANNIRISINRVSGTMRYQHAGTESAGSCELTSQQKF